MPKPPRKPYELTDRDKLAILDAQIRIHVQIINRLAGNIEETARQLNRAPTATEEEIVNMHRRRLRKYLQRRQAISCAMHTNQRTNTQKEQP